MQPNGVKKNTKTTADIKLVLSQTTVTPYVFFSLISHTTVLISLCPTNISRIGQLKVKCCPHYSLVQFQSQRKENFQDSDQNPMLSASQSFESFKDSLHFCCRLGIKDLLSKNIQA